MPNLRQHKIRLCIRGIDAERRQPLGRPTTAAPGRAGVRQAGDGRLPETDRYERAVCRLERSNGVNAEPRRSSRDRVALQGISRAVASGTGGATQKRKTARAMLPARPMGRPGAGGALGLQEGEERHQPVSPRAGFGSVFHFLRSSSGPVNRASGAIGDVRRQTEPGAGCCARSRSGTHQVLIAFALPNY